MWLIGVKRTGEAGSSPQREPGCALLRPVRRSSNRLAEHSIGREPALGKHLKLGQPVQCKGQRLVLLGKAEAHHPLVEAVGIKGR